MCIIINIRDWKNANISRFTDHLLTLPDSSFKNIETFINSLQNVIAEIIPLKEIIINTKNKGQWLSNNYFSAVKERDEAYKKYKLTPSPNLKNHYFDSFLCLLYPIIYLK